MAENEDLTLEEQYALYGQGRVNSTGRADGESVDPTQQYPRYDNEPSYNRTGRGQQINNLDVKLAKPEVPNSIQQDIASMYPRVKIDETPSGHIFELNDTPGGDRILMKHNNGSGYDIRPDGTIVTNSKSDHVQIVGEEFHLIVGGDGKLTFYGNLDLKVTGDMNMDVGGNFIMKVRGSVIADVFGSVTKKVVGNVRDIVKGIRQIYTLGKHIQITLGGFSNYIKGSFKQLVHGTAAYNHKDAVNFTGETDLDISSNNMNIAARDMSVFGDTGTIGGENIIMYNYNMHTKKTVWTQTMDFTAIYGTTVHADLRGTASAAKKAAVAGGLGGGGVPGLTNNRTAKDSTATAVPTAALLNDYLDNSSRGTRKVSIDEDGGISRSIDFSTDYGNVTDRELDSRETRAKMKNPANFENESFISEQIAAGNLTPDFANSAPGTVARVAGQSQTTNVGQTFIGSKTQFSDTKYKQSPGSTKRKINTFVVDRNYDPNKLTSITASTKLAKGLPISRFLGGYSDAANLNHITTLAEKQQIARNLLPHALIINTFNLLDSFNGYNLIIAEGLYKQYELETITPDSVLDYRKVGRAVVYEVYKNSTGSPSPEKLFEFAEFLKDSFQYQELSMRYDNFDPRKTDKESQLVVIVPQVPTNYSVKYDMNLSTYYNESKQSDEALVEFI